MKKVWEKRREEQEMEQKIKELSKEKLYRKIRR